MKTTFGFTNALKIAFGVVLFMIIASFLLSYYKMHGYSISSPETNTDLRVLLNRSKTILWLTSFWMLVGYMTKDFRSATAALAVAIGINFATNAFYAKGSMTILQKNVLYYLVAVSNVIPFLVYGYLHFKEKKAFKLVLAWLITFGLSIALDSTGFERTIGVFLRTMDLRDVFEFHVSTGENGYRVINMLQIVSREIYFILSICVFWWVYLRIRDDQPIWKNLNTLYDCSSHDRLSFSIVYWTFRFFLFIASFGIVTYVTRSFSFPFDIVGLFRVGIAAAALVLVTAMYRNFLISHFAHRNQYPGGEFLLLNIPVINIPIWIFTLIRFESTRSVATEKSELLQNFNQLKSQFVSDSRNGGWKIFIILISLVSMIYQMDRAGFRIDGPSRDGAFIVVIASIASFCMLLWFLYDKNAALPFIVLACLSLFFVALLRNESLVYPSMASSIINLVLFYGMFYFEEFKWAEEESLE